MINYLNFMIVFLLIILTIPVLIFGMQILFAAIGTYKKKQFFLEQKNTQHDDVSRPVVAILIPAHNEATGIGRVIEAIKPQLCTSDQLVVIADNCSDNTAEISRACGAVVIERFDENFKGKGYALDFGLQFLKQSPPEVLVIIDADCLISEALLETISRLCVSIKRPIQADYRMAFPTKPSLKQKVIEFAWIVKNKVRPSGYRFLNFPCQLMGTGMAFLWDDIVKCPLANGHLVEDIQLGIELAKFNKPPYYCDDAFVSSVFPVNQEGINSQRTRWEHGHLGMIFKEGPKLIFSAIKSKNTMLLFQTLDMLVPPIALLAISLISVFIISMIIYVCMNQALALVYVLVLLMIFGLSVFIAWYKFGKDVISMKELMLAPFIILTKIPIYLSFAFNRQVDWVRSKRD